MSIGPIMPSRTIESITKHGVTISAGFSQYVVDFGRRDTEDYSDWDDSQDFLTWGEAHNFAGRAARSGKHNYVVVSGIASLNGLADLYAIAEYPCAELCSDESNCNGK